MVVCCWLLYRLIFWTWEPPPPPSVGNLPPPALVRCGNGYQTIWPYHLSTWLRGQRTVKRYLRMSILSFRIFSNCSEKQPRGPFWLGFFRHSRLNKCSKTRIITISIPYHHHLFITFEQFFTTCFNPRGKVSCFAFLKLPWFYINSLNEEFLFKSWYGFSRCNYAGFRAYFS